MLSQRPNSLNICRLSREWSRHYWGQDIAVLVFPGQSWGCRRAEGTVLRVLSQLVVCTEMACGEQIKWQKAVTNCPRLGGYSVGADVLLTPRAGVLPQKARPAWLQLAQRTAEGQSILGHTNLLHRLASVATPLVIRLPSARCSQAASWGQSSVFYIPHVCHWMLCLLVVWDSMLYPWGRHNFLCGAAPGPADISPFDQGCQKNVIIQW